MFEILVASVRLLVTAYALVLVVLLAPVVGFYWWDILFKHTITITRTHERIAGREQGAASPATMRRSLLRQPPPRVRGAAAVRPRRACGCVRVGGSRPRSAGRGGPLARERPPRGCFAAFTCALAPVPPPSRHCQGELQNEARKRLVFFRYLCLYCIVIFFHFDSLKRAYFSELVDPLKVAFCSSVCFGSFVNLGAFSFPFRLSPLNFTTAH